MRIVVKVGSSTLTHETGRLNIRRTEKLCRTLSDVMNRGHEVILVSSGAVAMGSGKLGLASKPRDIASKQAAAAVGQCELMYIYDKFFSEYNRTVAQLLLTGDDFSCDERHRNLSATMSRLIEMGVLPIVNENDTVSTDEIKVGDNDTLSALVAVSVKADLLILLSDIDGLFTADPRLDPHAELIKKVDDIDDGIRALAGDSGTALGTGGMRTKLHAAEICTSNGCDMLIANGSDPEILFKALDPDESVGTLFAANNSNRK